MKGFGRDLAFAVRSLARRPLFTAAAALTLGATAAGSPAVALSEPAGRELAVFLEQQRKAYPAKGGGRMEARAVSLREDPVVALRHE